MVPTLAAVTAAAGVVTLALTVVARRFRDEPGGRWFVAMAAVMAGSSLLYAVALTVRGPFVRHLLEAAFATAALFVGVLWVAFALEYTGRGAFVRGPLGPVGLLAGAVGGAVVLTDPFHGLVFADFRVTTTMGAATTSFTPGPGLFATLGVVGVLTGVGWVLLFDAFADAGRLFGRQTVALAVTPLFPVVAAVLYAFDLGPVAGFNLVAVSFAPHAALDLYAMYGGELFEFDPATRRVGTRAALGSVGVPIVTVDTAGRVIALDDAENALFDRPERELVGDPLNDHLSTAVDPTADPGVVELRTPAGPRQFRVRTAPFGDGGRRLGYTVVFQDVTDVIARERRLSVLNRVLRHNLRNDLNVVVGHAELLADRDENDRSVQAILDRGRRLLSISERARELDRVVESTDPRDTVAVADLCREVADEAVADHPDASVSVSVSDDLRLRTDRRVLRIVVANLVANALEHGGSTVTVRSEADDTGRSLSDDDTARSGAENDTVRLVVADDGPGIPESEVGVLDESVETALDHGSGLGLWVVQSGVTALGGSVAFDGSDGTTVTLDLPGRLPADADRGESPREADPADDD